jgi:hypothetical protein
MKAILLIGAAVSLLTTGGANALPLAPQAGDAYEITRHRESAQQSTHGSGSTDDNDAISERVIDVRADGVELEYDLLQASAEDRKQNWQFPARIFRPFNGSAQLLNSAELEKRLDDWLEAAKWSREVCGRWIFTWDAFHIECDPQSVIKTVQSFDLRADNLRDGASYKEPEASVAGTLSRKASGPKGATYTVEMPIDPDAVRHDRAEADIVAGEILQKPITMEAALQKHAKETVSGTISVTFETSTSGAAFRRTKRTKLEITDPNRQSETETITEILERRLISQRH